MNDTVDRFYQATGELMVKAADYDALSAKCAELERRLAGAWVVRELEWSGPDWLMKAETILGAVYIERCHSGQILFVPPGVDEWMTFPSLDAAKAAAQQWFNEKMTAGLRRIV